MTSTTRAGHTVGAAEVLVEQSGPVRWLYLNRPERRNALTPTLISTLSTELAEAMADTATGAVVIAGRGASFCSGADLRYLLQLCESGGEPRDFLATIWECFTRIETAAKPVVAALHGHAVAGGLELALACDVVVAQAGTLIGDGHVRTGLLPGGGASWRLPRKVGEPLARWLMLTGELLPAERFVANGFVHSVVAPQQFRHDVAAVAARLAGIADGLPGRVKELLHRSDRPSPADAQAGELDIFARHWHDHDIGAGLRRFLNRGG
ncbi:MAG TPA: enoyl-CoA hydratase/isomerase family protein [Pseudonocardiaceae bacterium]|nr:enoyl-CoA hydratase/isomerase family protein [Pseudonocardiaceae bacterium]